MSQAENFEWPEGRDGITDQKICQIVNRSFAKGSNPSVKLLGGSIASMDRSANTLVMHFRPGPELGNGKVSTKEIQGGFSAAMLDCICAHTVLCLSRLQYTVTDSLHLLVNMLYLCE